MRKLSLLFGKLCLIACMAIPVFTSCNDDDNDIPEPQLPYSKGTFVLNERSADNASGNLIFISPENEITTDAYYTVNKSHLGSACQDLFIANGKMYIISQNGTEDGMLVIANAGTLKKEEAFSKEDLSELNFPTHIAVVGDNAYIRDGEGIYLLKLASKELTFIEGSKGALQNRMAVAQGKTFAMTSDGILVLQNGTILKKIVLESTPTGILKASDGNLWVAINAPAKIKKISSSDYSVIKENEIGEGFGLSAGWGSTPAISAKGEMIYFGNNETKIYRHNFTTGETQLMVNVPDHVENAEITYNTLAVNPTNGDVYVNTIKGYGVDFTTNNISVFNFENGNSTLVNNYQDLTAFPAGVFFTYSFE